MHMLEALDKDTKHLQMLKNLVWNIDMHMNHI
jgi:hypothetical protein